MLKGNSKIIFSYRESRYCLTSISQLNSSREMVLGKNWNFSISYRGYRDCFATNSFLQKLQCVSRLISRLPKPQKTRVFSFYVADVTVFQTFCFSLALPLSNPFQPKITFHSNPIIFNQKSLQNHFKVCVFNTLFIFST